MMLYHHLDKSISVHLSPSRVVSVFSERCNPSTLERGQSVCRECAAMEKLLCSSTSQFSHVSAKVKHSDHCCMGMNQINILWTAHGERLRPLLTFLRLDSQFPYSYLEYSFNVNRSQMGVITFHSEKCNLTRAISSMTCQECEDLEQSLCHSAGFQRKREMKIFCQDTQITKRIQLVLSYWENQSRRQFFMSTLFPHVVELPEDSKTTLLPFPFVNSCLGNFTVSIQDYKQRLCSGVVGDSSPISEKANREWLNIDLVSVIPWAAQTIAGPKFFVFNSEHLYNKLFYRQESRCMDKMSDSDLRDYFARNFPSKLISNWQFIFNKNVTVCFIVHFGGHFSNVIFGNLGNETEDTEMPFFAAVDCLLAHNREYILHNTKRYCMQFHLSLFDLL